MKKRVSICYVFSLVVLLFACSSKERIILNEDSIIEYGRVSVIVKGKHYQEEVNKFIHDNLKSQPKFLLKHLKKVFIYTDKEYEKLSVSKTSKAFSNPNHMSIHTRIQVKEDTLTHELAHIFDYVKGYHYYSSSDEFLKLYDAYRGTFHFYNDKKHEFSEKELLKYDEYFNNSNEEFFAGTFELYINHKSYLLKECKPIYDYLHEVISRDK